MWCKIVIIAVLATVAVQGAIEINEDQRTQLRGGLTKLCEKAGAADKVADVEKVITDFIPCINANIDIETIKKDIEEAKPHGTLDEVFKRHCAKSSALKVCFNNLVTGFTPCVEESSRQYLAAIQNASAQIIDFVCYKEGDRIALFIAEGGPECFQQKSNELRECAIKIKDSVNSVEAAQALSTQEKCKKFDEFTACGVAALEKCTNPTPANMFESVVRYIRKESPCPKAS